MFASMKGLLQLPAVFHVERLIHAAGDLDAEVLISGTFRHFHFMPFGKLDRNRKSRFRTPQSKQMSAVIDARDQLKSSMGRRYVGRCLISSAAHR